MSNQIDDLVAMRDTDTLYEILSEDEDWLTQFDAAHGLIKLNDRRGYEFVITAMLSDDEEILEVAKEIQDSAEFKKLQRTIEAEQESEKRSRLETAKKRLKQGGKVFRYKMVFLPSNALAADDPMSKGFEIPHLDHLGLEGWEVIHVLPMNRTVMSARASEHMTGVYCLLKREVMAGESAELDSK
jgi:hypothetical protein